MLKYLTILSYLLKVKGWYSTFSLKQYLSLSLRSFKCKLYNKTYVDDYRVNGFHSGQLLKGLPALTHRGTRSIPKMRFNVHDSLVAALSGKIIQWPNYPQRMDNSTSSMVKPNNLFRRFLIMWVLSWAWTESVLVWSLKKKCVC